MSMKNIRYHAESAVGQAAGTLAVAAVGIAVLAAGNLIVKGVRRILRKTTPVTA